MLKSITTKFAGVLAAVAVNAVIAAPANAFIISNPCSKGAPTIVRSGPSTIGGACFHPAAVVQVDFASFSPVTGLDFDPVVSLRADATGEFSLAMPCDPYASSRTEYVQPVEGNLYVYASYSNQLQINPPGAQ